MVSTSAPSAASSWLTPSFSKICVTVCRSAASETRTISFAGTLNRSRIMPHSFVGGWQGCAHTPLSSSAHSSSISGWPWRIMMPSGGTGRGERAYALAESAGGP